MTVFCIKVILEVVMSKRALAKNLNLKIGILLAYVLMILINVLANVLPLNGVTTGEISYRYLNLFAPAGYTFMIWTVIYILLGGFSIYQFRSVFYSPETGAMVMKLRAWFAVSCVANALWVIAWHYDLIALSFVFILGILISLIACTMHIHSAKLTMKERKWTQIPISIYFGWISVATVANLVTLLVKYSWGGSGLDDVFKTGLFIVMTTIIASLVVVKLKDIFFGSVVIWAYLGILVQHISKGGFNFEYMSIFYTIIVALVIMGISVVFASYKKTERLVKKLRN